MDINQLARKVLKREEGLFAGDYLSQMEALHGCFQGKSVCVIGAGGSIGRATARRLLELKPGRALLVDYSENNLAQITRDLRNTYYGSDLDFEAWALDFASPRMLAFLDREQPDVILNFAAYKHVRSEKDALTLAEMLRVNTLGNHALLEWALGSKCCKRVFVISTDKAANPASAMGATKRLMEMLLFSAAEYSGNLAVTSTRFANVLFSDGSLPTAFLERLSLGQPLAAPNDVKRYFMTPDESSMLCLLAASHSPPGEFLVPRMNEADMLGFDEIAIRLLKENGYTAKDYGEDYRSAFANATQDAAKGTYPCLFSASSTSGEKEKEEFREDREAFAKTQPYSNIEAVRPLAAPSWESLSRSMEGLNNLVSSRDWLAKAAKEETINQLRGLVPSFSHIETRQSLDKKI